MPKRVVFDLMPKALVTGADGVAREAKLSQLRPNSLLLHTDTPPTFRERVKVQIEEHTLTGEVVFVSGTEVALVFQTTPHIFELIELVETVLASQDLDRPNPTGDLAKRIPAMDTNDLVMAAADVAKSPANLPAPPSGPSGPAELAADLAADLSPEPMPRRGSSSARIQRSTRAPSTPSGRLPPISSPGGGLPPADSTPPVSPPIEAPPDLLVGPSTTPPPAPPAPPAPSLEPLPEPLPLAAIEPAPAEPEPNAELDPKGQLLCQGDMDTLALALMLLVDRPLYARGPSGLGKALLRDVELKLQAQDGLYRLSALNTEPLVALARSLKPTLEPTPGPTPKPEAPKATPEAKDKPEIGLPALLEDGRTVSFQSLDHYREEHKRNLNNGGLFIRGKALPLNSSHEFILQIPGRQPLPLRARVTFLDKDTLGLVIEGFDTLKPALEALLQDSVRPRPRRSSVPRGTSGRALVVHRGPFSSGLGLPALLRIRERKPQNAQACEGLYLSQLELLFRLGGRYTITFTKGDERISLWIYSGRLVFTMRSPTIEEDTLGRRLLARRTINRLALKTALRVCEETKKPLGEVLLERGLLSQGALSKHLKMQMLDRVLHIKRMGSGQVHIDPWEEPKLKGKLAAFAGNALLLELFREHIKDVPQEALQSELDEDPGRILNVRGLEDDPGLSQKERRILQRAQEQPTAVRMLGGLGASSQLEALRTIALSRAAGLLTLEQPRQEQLDDQESQTRDLLTQRLKEAKSNPPFQALNLHWMATFGEITAAYETERQLLESRRESDPLSPLVNDLLKALESAYTKLSKADERTRLRRSEADQAERVKATKHLLEQAERAIFKEDVVSAMELLLTADEIYPTNKSKRLQARIEQS